MHKTPTLHLPHNQKPFRQILQNTQQNKKKNKNHRNKIDKNEERITRIKNKSKGIGGKISKTDITRQNRVKRRKKLEKETKQLRRDLSEKRKQLQGQESINERIRAIYDTDTAKAAKQRFNTIYNK